MIFAARSLGKPKMPVEIAGNAMDAKPNSSATHREPVTAAASFASSPPSPQTGPTAWITYFAGSAPPEVQAGREWETSPCFAIHASLSSWITSPPRRTMDHATPPPCCKCSLAALTMASTSSSVMSPCAICRAWPVSKFFSTRMALICLFYNKKHPLVLPDGCQ